MTIVAIKVDTTGSAGSATGSATSRRIRGFVEAVYFDFNASAPATTDVTITASDPVPHTITSVTDSNTDITQYPVTQGAHDGAYRKVYLDWQTVTVNVAQCDELVGAVTVYLSVQPKRIGKTTFARSNILTFTATTTAPSELVTINQLQYRVGSGGGAIDWGDGVVENIAENITTARTHTYATAGTYNVTVTKASSLIGLQLSSNKIGNFNTAQIRNASLTLLVLSAITNSTINTHDFIGMAGMANFQMFSLPAGGVYVIDTEHLSNMTALTALFFFVLPSGGTYRINTLDLSAMAGMTDLRLFTIVGATFNVPSNSLRNLVALTNYQAQGNALPTAQVDATLAEFVAMGANRTATGGTINLGGSNEAPSATGLGDRSDLLDGTYGGNAWTTITVSS